MTLTSTLTASALAVCLSVGAVSAATYTWTEGNNQNRKLVAGSVDLQDADSSVPGFELGDAFTADDTLQIHGRIVSSLDTFSYSFTMTENFNVSFDLDGYDLAASAGGGTETLSGLVGQSVRGGDPVAGLDSKGVKFTLTGGGTTVIRSFQTDILSGDNGFIFSGRGGFDYTLTVDGSAGPNKNKAALYDLTIAAVPIPAAGMLFLSALGGLAFATRRRQKS